MSSHARVRIALAGVAVMVGLAAGAGGVAGLSNATPPPAPAAPGDPTEEPPPPPPGSPGLPAPSTKNKAPSGRKNYLLPSEIR